MAASGHNTFQQARPNKLQRFPRAANRTRNASSPAFHPAIPLQCQLNPQNVLAAQCLIGNRAVVQLLSQAHSRETQSVNKTGLPTPLKTGMESLSGIDLSDVRVHYNSEKPAQLQALAYAQGEHIYLGAGQEQHLPHEAWHVVQQKQGRVKPTLRMKEGVSINDNPILEKEADVMGKKAILGRKENAFPLFPLQMMQERKNQTIQCIDNLEKDRNEWLNNLKELSNLREDKVGKPIKFESGDIIKIGKIDSGKWKIISEKQGHPVYVQHIISEEIDKITKELSDCIKNSGRLNSSFELIDIMHERLKKLIEIFKKYNYLDNFREIIFSRLTSISKKASAYEDVKDLDSATEVYYSVSEELKALKHDIYSRNVTAASSPDKQGLDVEGLNVKIVFLGKGSANAGLEHILLEHKNDFENVGIPEGDIASVVMEAVTEGKVVDVQRTRPIFEFTYKGAPKRIAVTIGNNGYIIGANPVRG